MNTPGKGRFNEFRTLGDQKAFSKKTGLGKENIATMLSEKNHLQRLRGPLREGRCDFRSCMLRRGEGFKGPVEVLVLDHAS